MESSRLYHCVQQQLDMLKVLCLERGGQRLTILHPALGTTAAYRVMIQ
jgi:hypothetical protein